MDEPLPLLTGQGDDTSNRKYLFDAVLQPNTSLNPKGFLLLMTAIASVSFAAGMAFMLTGALSKLRAPDHIRDSAEANEAIQTV